MNGLRQDWAGRFEIFDSGNPHVYQAFKKYAIELLNAGRRSGSAAAIFERIRWDSNIKTEREQGLPEWKLNNSFRSIMSRKLAAEDERFAHFFEFRQQTSLAAKP